MLSYFVRYREFIKLNLFVPPACEYVETLTLDRAIRSKANAAFDARFSARLRGAT